MINGDVQIKSGVIGVTLLSTVSNIALHDVIFTIIMAVIGAVVSFVVSYALKRIFHRDE